MENDYANSMIYEKINVILALEKVYYGANCATKGDDYEKTI